MNNNQRIIITALSVLLALSIISNLVLIQKLDINGDKSSTDSIVSSESAGNIDEEFDTVGNPSNSEFGDYKSAKSYEEIYDYLSKQFQETFIGGIYKENATNDLAIASTEESAESAGIGGDIVSSTNVMTDSVDESDISKIDGNYIYNATDGEIIIFDIKDEVKLVNTFIPDFESPSDIIREIFLDKDMLTVITEHTDTSDYNSNTTKVLIYDISDRENEVLIDSYSQDGNFNTIRKVKDIIYLFTNKFLENPEMEKADAILAEGIGEWFPKVNGKIVDSNCVYIPKSGSYSLIMSSFSQNDTKTIDAKIIINDYSEIYVGNNGIYLYNTIYGNRQLLNISKLPYENGNITTGNMVSLRGSLNDKFAINEYNDQLRVVTTEFNDNITNSLYVLDNDLKVSGQINNIANGEQLYSCRFLGDMGYFVTFRQTDPLFTVDLKDAKNPKIVGELHIPGFSEYLHFWGDNKLLGLGYDADESGVRNGIKLSMYDISDPTLVKEEAKLVLNGEDYAPGFYNYKAVLAFKEKDLFGFSYIDYDSNSAKYSFFEYKDGSFNEVATESVGSEAQNRARGHVVNDRLFLSVDTEVVELNR